MYEIEPWGDWAENARNAHIVTTLANINRDPKKREKPFGLEEFMLFNGPMKKAEQEYKGAVIAPETITWLFAASRKNKSGN